VVFVFFKDGRAREKLGMGRFELARAVISFGKESQTTNLNPFSVASCYRFPLYFDVFTDLFMELIPGESATVPVESPPSESTSGRMDLLPWSASDCAIPSYGHFLLSLKKNNGCSQSNTPRLHERFFACDGDFFFATAEKIAEKKIVRNTMS